MAEKDNTGKFAEFQITGASENENGDTVLHFAGLTNDEDFAEAAAAELTEEVGGTSWNHTIIRRDGSRRSSFHFSGDKWKAPWQPTGPKPNWQEKADPTEPIN